MTEEKKTEKTEKGEKTEEKKPGFLAQFRGPRVPYSRLFLDETKNARAHGQGIDPDSDDIKTLAESIKVNGLKEPLVVRIIKGEKLTENDRALIGLDEKDEPLDYYAKVIAGARRYHAIGRLIEDDKSFMKEGIKISIEEGKLDEKDEFFSMMAENIDREQLTPGEQAEAIYRARKELGLSSKEIHERLPKLSAGHISHLYSLRTKLSEKSLAAFMSGEIAFDVARLILEAGDHDAQDKALAKVFKHVEDTGQQGKKKKKGLKEVARKAAKGEAESAPGVKRPKMTDIKEKLSTLEEEATNAYLKGQRDALRWVSGAKKKLPAELPKAK